MLVAALAAGDLAGTDRDQAIDLTRACADCSRLHDDLLAIARATAATPPPYAMPARDLRLTPADAARLRPGGWRRIAAPFGGFRGGFGRPLGVGLATLGVLGLLVGNIQLPARGAASPEIGRSSTTSVAAQDTSKNGSSPTEMSVQGAAGAAPAASATPAASMAAAPAPDASPSDAAVALRPVSPVMASSGGADALASSAPESEATRLQATIDESARETGSTSLPSLLQVASILAIVAGLAVLAVASIRSRRRT